MGRKQQSLYNFFHPASSELDGSGLRSGSESCSAGLRGPRKRPLSSEVCETEKPLSKEERYWWLEDCRDANGNRLTDPSYDPKTLYVPEEQWNRFTPFEKQYWEIKCMHFDKVVFFKKGKFYELYEQDALVGSREFDLKLTDRVNMKMVGVPEASLDYWINRFVAMGHKIVRVDQTESMIGKQAREKKSRVSVDDKIIRRQVSCILTMGTLLDVPTDMANYCVSIKEEIKGNQHRYGVSFVDVSTLDICLCSLVDDTSYSVLETCLVQINPKEMVYEKGGMHPKTLKWVQTMFPNTALTPLFSRSEFWDCEQTCRELCRYFRDGEWPSALDRMKDDAVGMESFGGLLFYLKSLRLDDKVLCHGQFHTYHPHRRDWCLVLDGQTLVNLEIFNNNFDSGERGTLFHIINHCTTVFGKRMLRRWVCYPLYDIRSIKDRLDCVDYLYSHEHVQARIRNTLKMVPDLERLFSKIHHKRCNLKELISLLDGLELVFGLMEWWRNDPSLDGMRIKDIVIRFPSIGAVLDEIGALFDKRLSLEGGRIVPLNNDEYNQLDRQVRSIEKDLEEYLVLAKRQSKCFDLRFRHIGALMYQLEAPLQSNVPSEWILLSKTSSVHRYHTSELRNKLKRLDYAKEQKSNWQQQYWTGVLDQISQHRKAWTEVVKVLAKIDCLSSLCQYRAGLGPHCCRPEFVESSGNVFEAKGLYHPVLLSQSQMLVPNDIVLGGEHPTVMVLTGPNMGGKSTLLRQICLTAILGQLGCYLPAQSVRMSCFDRIFTRIGANDNIVAGQSTFMVELQETSKILNNASDRSLVILDELGRGTCTTDGYAISYAVVNYISQFIGCLCLFSTHYTWLARELGYNQCIQACFMDFCTEDQSVVFLYKLRQGVSPKSYGLNVAQMAGLDPQILERASEIASQVKPETSTRPSNVYKLSNMLYLMSIDESASTNGVRRIISHF